MNIKKDDRIDLLLVEDDVDFRTSLANRLSKKNCNVTAVSSAEDALKELAEDKFQVIVSDIKLERMDGLEFLSRVKEINEDLPVILITGFANLDTARQAVVLNAYNYLVKPLDNISDILIPIKNAVQSYYLKRENKLLREHYENIVTSVPDGILTINSTSLIIESVNKTFLKMFNTSQKEVVGKKIDKVFDKEVSDKIAYLMETLGLEGNTVNFEWLTLGKADKIFWADISIKRAIIQKKESLLMVVSDITNLKHAEEERKNVELQYIRMQKQESLGSLTGGIAHEFNNILSVILGHAQVSMTEDELSEIKKSLAEIEKATIRGSRLVENMTSFASPSQPDLIPQDIGEVIDSVIQLQERQLKIQNIEIEKNYNNKQYPFFDTGQMEQVFLNLLINSMHAIKPIGKGKITISVNDDADSVIINFQDTGIGMNREIQPKIFDPFFTTKGAYSKDEHEIGGSGLGLAVTSTIIKQHHGTISVESEEKKGSAFIIKLPSTTVNREAKKIKLEAFQKIDIEKMKELSIIVIDDEEDMANLMNLVFKKAGFQHYTIEQNPRKAISYLNSNKPDIIFLDMMMPDMDGRQVFNEIKQMGYNIPVVLMSGKIDLHKEEIMKIGSFDFIKKPFNINELYRVLNRIVV